MSSWCRLSCSFLTLKVQYLVTLTLYLRQYISNIVSAISVVYFAHLMEELNRITMKIKLSAVRRKICIIVIPFVSQDVNDTRLWAFNNKNIIALITYCVCYEKSNRKKKHFSSDFYYLIFWLKYSRCTYISNKHNIIRLARLSNKSFLIKINLKQKWEGNRKGIHNKNWNKCYTKVRSMTAWCTIIISLHLLKVLALPWIKFAEVFTCIQFQRLNEIRILIQAFSVC